MRKTIIYSLSDLCANFTIQNYDAIGAQQMDLLHYLFTDQENFKRFILGIAFGEKRKEIYPIIMEIKKNKNLPGSVVLLAFTVFHLLNKNYQLAMSSIEYYLFYFILFYFILFYFILFYLYCICICKFYNFPLYFPHTNDREEEKRIKKKLFLPFHDLLFLLHTHHCSTCECCFPPLHHGVHPTVFRTLSQSSPADRTFCRLLALRTHPHTDSHTLRGMHTHTAYEGIYTHAHTHGV